MDGEKLTDRFIPSQTNIALTIDGDKADLNWQPPKGIENAMKQLLGKLGWQGVVHLDSRAKPKRMAAILPNDNSNSMISNYRLDGDRLTLCYRADPRKLEYPSDFATKADDGLVLLVIARVATTPPAPGGGAKPGPAR